MRFVVGVAVVSLIAAPVSLKAQNQQEQMIVDAIGSSAAVEVATQYMSVSESAARSVSSDVAIPGPGMLDVDPVSTRGEWAVNYETSNLEMCRAITATAFAAVVENHASGEWTISTSCLNSMVEVNFNLDQEVATGEQWQGPDGYVWQNSWQF